jgi:glutathione S-transferase
MKAFNEERSMLTALEIAGATCRREWFFDHFTAADAHFFWCFRRGTQFNLDVSAFKNCVAHFERMKQRPSVRKLLAYEEKSRPRSLKPPDHSAPQVGLASGLIRLQQAAC